MYSGDDHPLTGPEFRIFRMVTAEIVKDYVNTIGRKSCNFDPIPASVLCSCKDILPVLNNYSPKAMWLSVNIHRDEVEVNIHR